jgi:glucose-6-phosphate 1-dehydrogenase
MQNHLLQVLTLLAMERPISFSSEDIRDEKVRVLRAMDAIEPKNVIIGQYGRSLDGSKPGYLEDDTVPKESRCPTFCALVAYIKNERWDGVPFILKAGKGMSSTDICFQSLMLTFSPSPQRAEDRGSHPVQGRDFWYLQGYSPQRAGHPCPA